MKFIAIIVLSIAVLFSNNSVKAQTCDQTLWNHVYHNYRLAVHDSCMSATGTVYSLIYEADGDIHIRLTVDAAYTYMLNSYNYSGELGKLIIEPVCATTITQPDAVSACVGFSNSVFIPAVGEYVKCTGDYVTDNDHGWNEIHPVTSIIIIPPAGIQNTSITTPDVTVFPNPANNYLYFKLSEKPSNTVYITISDESGRLAGQYQMLEMLSLKINSTYLPSGKYFYHVSQNSRPISGGSFVIEH